jgi:hypothetical protein
MENGLFAPTTSVRPFSTSVRRLTTEIARFVTQHFDKALHKHIISKVALTANDGGLMVVRCCPTESLRRFLKMPHHG